jgi:lysophospholipase L1-like esterase
MVMSIKNLARAVLPVLALLALPAAGQVPVTEPSAGSRAVIVVIGASYAQSWPITEIGGQRVINAGVGGNETRDMLARFEQDVLTPRPGAVLIWGFINDYTRSRPEKHPEAAKLIQERFTAMVEQAQARGIKVVLATETTLPKAKNFLGAVIATIYRTLGRSSYQDRINTRVMESNAWLREFAGSRKLPVLDFQRTLAPRGFYRERRYASEDGSHFSSEAYAALTQYVDSRKEVFGP